jgi:hypothetical protein
LPIALFNTARSGSFNLGHQHGVPRIDGGVDLRQDLVLLVAAV